MLIEQRTVLVVEDNPGIGLVLRVLLEGESFIVTLAVTVSAGVAALREQAFDLILTDSFSQTPATALDSVAPLLAAAGDTPLALMTAHDIPISEVRARGICALISKPFEIEAVLDSIQRCLDGTAVLS